jgi:hypothetical protein
MSEKNLSLVNLLDKSIHFFLIIFLLTLSNSIFLNQLGYYFALILLLIKWALTKQNPFSKTGLEFALILFIVAEILSTLFSNHFSESFNNLLKRILLIPIIYVIIASINDTKKAIQYSKIYLGATIVTVLIYLFFAVEHYVKGLYGITESGPSIFQYPITASEIISFTVIFLFAFLLNEKTSIRNKLLILLAFLLSALALYSTYKRTGWMGAAFGIIIILILKKQWKLLTAGLVLFIIFINTQKNISEVNFYQITKDNIHLTKTLRTDGRAYDASRIEDNLVISDYNNGLVIINNDSTKTDIQMPSAVIGFYHWRDNYYIASLIDSRFIVMKDENNRYIPMSEIFSPGLTYSHCISNDYLYILDRDSGLTVFTNPTNSSEFHRFPQFNGYTNVFADSAYILFAEPNTGLVIFKLSDKLPSNEILFKHSSEISFIFYSSPFLFIENENGLNIYKLENDRLTFIKNFNELRNVSEVSSFGDVYCLLSINTIYQLNKNSNDEFNLTNKFVLNYNIKSLQCEGKDLIVTRVENKQSRLLGIFDPYHPSNANRIAFWKAGIKMFLDNPIFGVGDIDLAKYYVKYKEPYNKEIQGHLHNNFFHILATLGIVGLLAVLFLFFKIIQIDLKIIKELNNIQFAHSFAIGTLASFSGFLVSGLTELNFFDHEIATLVWFTFGLNFAFFALNKNLIQKKPDTNSTIK